MGPSEVDACLFTGQLVQTGYRQEPEQKEKKKYKKQLK